MPHFSSISKSLLLLWLSFTPLPYVANGYDINCIYPENMPDPFTARYLMVEEASRDAISRQAETPMIIYTAQLIGLASANCVAYHDDRALNALTKSRPLLVAPSFGHNSFSRVMCMAQAYSLIFDATSTGSSALLKRFFDEWGLPVTGRNRALVKAIRSLDIFEVARIVVDADYHPFMIGQIVAFEILNFVIQGTDGWNAGGSLTYDAETDSVVPCTANCQPFSDTTGYMPRNYPRKFSPDEDKYAVNGTDMLWQPLLESDGQGYFSRQEHVVPHLGQRATPVLRPYGEVSPPDYDYQVEAELVIEHLRKTASSVDRKTKIKFFDNKFAVRGLLQWSMTQQFAGEQSFEDQIMYIYGLGLVEYDALLNAWKEKVRYDLVRPTTVIQRWGNDEIETYSGDPASTASSTIKARDFQAYIRVMPHSEYPSGSACLCTAYTELTKAYTDGYGRPDLVDLEAGPNAWNFGCDDGRYPGLFFGCTEEEVLFIPDMDSFADQCGQSRLWGGMHFTASVSASNQLCEGLGQLGYAVVEEIRNDSNFTSSYRQGDPLPDRNAPGASCSAEAALLSTSVATTVSLDWILFVAVLSVWNLSW